MCTINRVSVHVSVSVHVVPAVHQQKTIKDQTSKTLKHKQETKQQAIQVQELSAFSFRLSDFQLSVLVCTYLVPSVHTHSVAYTF